MQIKQYVIILLSLLGITSVHAAVGQDTLWAKVVFKVVDQDNNEVKDWSVILRDTADDHHMYYALQGYRMDTILIPVGFVFKVNASSALQFTPEIHSSIFISIKPHSELANTIYRYVLTIRIVKYPDILFASGSAELGPAEKAKLDKMIQFYKDTLDSDRMFWGFAVKGYTDSIGAAKANLDLSRRRAEAVWNYIEERVYGKGFRAFTPASCVKYYGETKPIASNTTAAGRQQNRRVSVAFRYEVIAITGGETDPCQD